MSDLSDDEVAAIMQTIARLRLQIGDLEQRGFTIVPVELRKALDDLELNLWEWDPDDHSG
jgi:hypothetical protein